MNIQRMIISIVFTFCALLFSTASMADHAWGAYHWERSINPFTVPLGSNVDSEWEIYLGFAPTDWFVSGVLNTTVIAGSSSPRRCKTTSGTVQVCNLTYGNNGWLGIASISISGGHITAGYVKLNDTYFNTTKYDDPAWRQMVMCQEIGHTFGLGHQDENFSNANLGTCMDYTSDPDGTLNGQLPNEHPNAHDYGQLTDIYAHLDSNDSGGGGSSGCNPKSPKCNPTPAADILDSIEMNGPAQWGRLVSEHGPQEVYELDFGGGRKVVTWTLERAYNHKH
jgi:hypothetical protein